MTCRSRSLPSAHNNVTCTSPVPNVSPGGTARGPAGAATVVGVVEVGAEDVEVEDAGVVDVDGRGAASPPPSLLASPTTIRRSTKRAITPIAPAAPAATHGHGTENRAASAPAAGSGDD